MPGVVYRATRRGACFGRSRPRKRWLRAVVANAKESEETMGKRGSTPVDMRRVIRAAVDAALEDPAPQPRRKRRLSGGRVLLLGAGLMTAGKLVASSRGREMFGTIRDRMEDAQDKFLRPDDGLPEDAEALDAEDVDAEEEEPQGEAIDDELGEGEELGDSSEDDELDEDEPEPQLEEDAQPRRTVRTRRPRADLASPVRRDRKRSRGGGSRRQAVE